MDINQLIENILEEVSWRTKEGYPDFTINEHLDILVEVLRENDINNDIISEIISNVSK